MLVAVSKEESRGGKLTDPLGILKFCRPLQGLIRHPHLSYYMPFGEDLLLSSIYCGMEEGGIWTCYS